MQEVFAKIYEWFGLIPFYSKDMGDHLRGFDVTCTDYIATPWYSYIGWIMLVTTIFTFALQYYIVDSPKYSQARHWWFFALGLVLLNFLIAFAIPYNDIQDSNFCNQLKLNVSDCVGFGFSNALWSLIMYIIISTIPIFRKMSTNCEFTTFWKP